jgi:glycine/D-amino acid oxidase-like deaminating enzyme
MQAEACLTTQTQAPWRESLSPQVASALELPRLESLSAEACEAVEVAIIGGGIAGLSAALSAAQAGARVLLLESAPSLGLGASGRNAGILSPGVNMPLIDTPCDSPAAALWLQTSDLLHELISEANQPGSLLEAKLTGAFVLGRNRSAAKRLIQEARARVSKSLLAEPCGPSFVANATAGRLNLAGVELALWLPDEGRIQPLTLLAHLAQKARRLGCVLAGGAPVVKTEENDGGAFRSGWQLTLSNGRTIKARALVRAVGPGVAPSARLYALAFDACFPDDFPLFWDAAPYVYYDFRPGSSRLVVSGGRYGRAGAVERDRRYHRRMAEETRRWLPELSSAEPSHAWAVDLKIDSELLPNLRLLSGSATGLAIEGLGALGVLPGIVLGRRAGKELASQL